MCGIAGIVSPNIGQFEPELARAVKALKHRGPDADGVFAFGRCALGHARLSIVDLSSGAQPMLTADQKIGLSFNGEIYGYKEIRDGLAGYPFQTSSDTEVIIALYRKHGPDMMDKLPGMFAFALWDDEQQRLFCARDRFGEKPFYYAFGRQGELVFASEIKAILATGLVEPVLDRESVAHYLKRLYVRPDKTIYKNIFTLPPAHSLSFDATGLKIRQYWQQPKEEQIGLPEATEKFRHLLDRAVAKQLVADVPVGAFLSGGLDSTTIVALASRHAKKIKTFSFGFGDSINELPFASQAAKKYGTEHLELQAGDYDLAEMLREMQAVYDEPFADSSNIPTYIISKLAREHVKVVLTGDGGDELCGGYWNWYRPLFNMSLRQQGTGLFRYLLQSVPTMTVRNLYYSHLGLDYAKRFNDIESAHLAQNSFFSDSDIAGLLGAAPQAAQSLLPDGLANNTLNDAMRIDIADYMPGDILVKIDRAAMANGLELRAPFLDADFASFCISLPATLKVTAREDKLILREAFRQEWPEAIRTRKKQGFGAPVAKWLEDKKVIELKGFYLDDQSRKIFQLVDFEKSRRFVRQNSYQAWILLNLSMWLEQHEFVLA